MEVVKILGVDPALRNTGLSIVSFNTEMSPTDPAAFKVQHCQTLVNPQKYTGTDAILNMLDMIYEQSQKPCYKDVDTVLVESPAIMFNKTWSQGTISSMAHISGGAVALLGIEKAHLFRPNEWNKNRKKDITHNNTVMFLGSSDTWGYEKVPKNDKVLEHIIDATSMALWWIKNNYIED